MADNYETGAEVIVSPEAHFPDQDNQVSATGNGGRMAIAYGGTASDQDDESQGGEMQWVAFPVEALPEPFATYVRDVAHARQCDPAAVAIALLASMAGTIGNARVVRIGPSYYVVCVLWVGTVNDSGTVKTPAWLAGLAAAKEVEAKGRRDWEEEHGDLRTAKMRHDAELAAWRRAENGGDPPPPLAPIPRLIVEDATFAALVGILVENPRGVLMARDELSGWVRSFDQFTGASGADLSRWLEMYGAGTVSADRKADGHVFVSRAAVSVTGTIQTRILPHAFGEEQQAAGLLARFLLISPPEPRRRFDPIRNGQAPDVDTLVARFSALRSLELPEEGKEPKALELSPEAVQLYAEWFKEHEIRRHETEPGVWRSALAKLEEIPNRLGLVLALARADQPDAVEVVDGDTMRRAIKLTNWFRNEGERVYGLMAESDEERAGRGLVAWVTSRGKVTAREVAQGMRKYRGTGGTERAQQALCRLEEAGKLESEEQQGQRGPGVRVYRPAPSSTSTGFRVHQRESDKPVDVDTVEEGEI